MAMWEIDTLLTDSIKFIKASNLDNEMKKHLVWNLENIPELYKFDAGGFEKSELDSGFEYQKINPYKIGEIITMASNEGNTTNLIYDWSAFLLNFWQDYFSDTVKLEDIKSTHLLKMKEVFSTLDFTDYEPIHATLTIYKDGKGWFSQEQNELTQWYCT
ncbi:MAG: hypothetical protein ACK5NK_06835 [Niabella sp.]